MDKLSKEQLLLLQDNLSYSVYDRFMCMFPKYEVLPMDSEVFCEKIVSMMKKKYKFYQVLLGIFIVGIIAHRLFCVRSSVDKMLFK